MEIKNLIPSLIILIAINIILLLFVNTIESIETVEDSVNSNDRVYKTYEITKAKHFAHNFNIRESERYDDKLFDYLEHIQDSRDKTFHKGKVFIKQR
jgi:hypothetical protein